MTKRCLPRNVMRLAPIALMFTGSAMAEWRAANEQVATGSQRAQDRVRAKAVNRMDAALVKDDHAAFAALLAKDLVVNNPQNGISINGATGNRDTAGLISYSSYVRSIEYAGMRDEMVLLMGDERVVPKGDSPMAGKDVRRRFTDLWKMEWPLGADRSAVDDRCTVRMYRIDLHAVIDLADLENLSRRSRGIST